MITTFIIILVGALGLCVGYFSREVRDYLKRIEKALKILVERQKREEAQEIAKKKGMSFGDPMSMAELADMEDEERIDALNKNM